MNTSNKLPEAVEKALEAKAKNIAITECKCDKKANWEAEYIKALMNLQEGARIALSQPVENGGDVQKEAEEAARSYTARHYNAGTGEDCTAEQSEFLASVHLAFQTGYLVHALTKSAPTRENGGEIEERMREACNLLLASPQRDTSFGSYHPKLLRPSEAAKACAAICREVTASLQAENERLKGEVIGFPDWINKNYWVPTTMGNWYRMRSDDQKTTAELYQMYLATQSEPENSK